MGQSAGGTEKKRFLFDLFGKPESLPVVLFVLFLAILYGAGPDLRSAKHVFESPWLLFTLNTVFITALCLVIAWLCIRSFLRGGFLNVLLLGCGVLAFGLSSFAAGWLIRVSSSPNYAVTLHNLGVLSAAVLFFLSSLFTAFGFSLELEKRRGQIGVMAYAVIFGLGAFLTTETVFQRLPTFFVVGEGPTVIRQVVLSVAVTLLFTSSLLMMPVYAKRKSGFLLFTINALLLIVTGLIGEALAVPGSPLSWLGRAAQYLGDVYLVVASMKALGEARSSGTTVERALGEFFRKSETHYKALMEIAADAIIAINREGKIILINPAAEETFGYGQAEAFGKNLEDLIVPGQSRDPFRACMSGESRRDMEMELTRKDGSIFPAELSFSSEMKSDGGSERTIIIHDITERKQAEKALRESESRFRTLAGATFEGVAVTKKGRITDINEQFCKISGFDRSELLGMDVSKLVHPDDRERVLDNILAGRESVVEHRMIRKDGSLITVEAHGKTVQQDGRVRRLTTVRDVTKARKAEEAIRSAALFPIQNPSPVLRIHRDGTLLFSNSAAETILAAWRTQSGRVIPVRVQEVVEAVLNEGVSQELDFQTAGRIFSFVIAPVPAEAYANLYGRDVTEPKRAEEALRDSEERYRGLFESMNEGFALHELIFDEHGEPCNYRFLDVNPAFERQTGLKREDVIGKTVLEVMPGTEQLWIQRYGEVVLSGTPAHFVSRAAALGRDFEVFAYRPAPGQFAVVFMDITDRRQAEESLRASYQLLKIAQRAANAGVWNWEISTGKLTWSEEFYSLFGLDPAAPASFDTWLGVLHPDDRQTAMERIDGSIREGYPLENEYRIIRPDGQERWIRAWGSTVYDESAQPLSMSGICIDATESKRAEEALRASELRMKAVADNLPVGVWFADETGKIIYGNEVGRRIWAGARYVDPAEFHVYRAWWTDSGKPLGPEEWAVARAVRHGETSLNEILDIECFDGTRKTILNSAVPLKSDGGGLLGVVILNEDITERIGIEQALRRSEARYRSYIEVTGQMGWTTNADGAIVEDIPGWREYTGQTFDEMRGWGWSRALHPDDLEITLAVWRKAVEEKQSYETEYRLRRHDGVYRHFLARGLPALQEDGSVREWVGTCIDITELHRVQEALKISKEALRLANEELEHRVRERTAELMLTLEDLQRSRDDLRRLASELVLTEERERKKISVTLHDEVAQTLAAARMRIDLLRSRPGDDDFRRALDEAQQLLVQAIRETRSLMTDISNPVLYDMGLRVAVQSLTEEMNARQGISFESSLDGGLRGLGQDMEVMLFQVVKELAQNVVKHSGARKASIRISEERDDIKVVVADDGLGFEVGNIGSVGLDGGFGLFSIRERVKSYGGKIKIKSEPGKGSEVIVMLPKKAAGVAASRKTAKKKETT